jgi:hypothetical protein
MKRKQKTIRMDSLNFVLTTSTSNRVIAYAVHFKAQAFNVQLSF